jgi:hypothetical protein
MPKLQAHLQFAQCSPQGENCKRACKASAEMKEENQIKILPPLD